MKIIVNGKEIEVEENDEVYVSQEPCDVCGCHTTITIDRNKKQIFIEEL